MNEEILRIALFTAYGNAILNGKQVSFDKNHPAGFKYDSIKFIQDLPDDQLKWSDYLANNPNEWFRYLKEKDYSRLYLFYNPTNKPQLQEQTGTAFAGGSGQWTIIAEKNGMCDIWAQKAQLEQGEVRIYYYIQSKDAEIPKITITQLDKVKLYLREILKDMVGFTIKSNLSNWQDVFQKALICLSIDDEEELMEKDYLPEDCFSLEAKQVLVTCDQAWVFGGMGSWSDVVQVHDYNLYSRLTANLYDTLCKAIASAINSYPE
jgi:hypothetical protein